MSNVLSIQDGQTYSHLELQTLFGFKTERAIKDWLCESDVPFTVIGGRWWIAAEDLRKAMRLRATTVTQKREERLEAV